MGLRQESEDRIAMLPTTFSGGRETKLFDPADWPASLGDVVEITDASVAKRNDQWWMFLAGQAGGYGATQLFSASLPPGAPLSATGWQLTLDPADAKGLAPLADFSGEWDLNGGRHCPSYVRGLDPRSGRWVERIYYAGSAQELWGPYAIGYLEWDGSRWVDQASAAFVAKEEWERGSVYEPNLIYADGKWKMWYVAGSNHEDYLVHGYAESADGIGDWSDHRIFAVAEEKIFDFCVFRGPHGYEAVFSRVWLGKTPPPAETGLWWCSSKVPSPDLSQWSQPVQIMTAEDRGWHMGPWKPSLQYDGPDSRHMFVFFDGCYRTSDPGPFPFAFTLGCLEIERPEKAAVSHRE
jgi:hypothetical protein